jgi:acyl carrier protein
MNIADLTARIRHIIVQYARLIGNPEELADGANLYQAGMTSHAGINVMVALESEFDFEFPHRMLKPSTFRSIESIREAIEEVHRSDSGITRCGVDFGHPQT